MERKEKIEAVRHRLKEYAKHCNDPYAYYEGEIKAASELHSNAVEDITFLLSELARHPDKQPIRQESHFGHDVWVNPTIEALRGSECLCRNCGAIVQCPIAKSLLNTCVKEHMAMAITRCFHWKPIEA
ncbi:MAG: hypothetical protein Q8N90_03735 [bacterium]|nr:hypothetical protein [bacterium]